MCPTSDLSYPYIGVFTSLTSVNAVKRMFGNMHLPMRNVPSCLRSRGCSYSIGIGEDIIDEVVMVAVQAGIEAKFYKVSSSDDGLKRYDSLG